jgi:hypothetical protein
MLEDIGSAEDIWDRRETSAGRMLEDIGSAEDIGWQDGWKTSDRRKTSPDRIAGGHRIGERNIT